MPAQKERIHRFKFGDRTFGVDVESCFTFETDAIGHEALEHYGLRPLQEIVKELSDRFPTNEIREVLSELESLHEEGHILRDGDFDADADGSQKKNKSPEPAGRVLTLMVPDLSDASALQFASTSAKALDLVLMKTASSEKVTIEFLSRTRFPSASLVQPVLEHVRRRAEMLNRCFDYRLVVRDVALSNERKRALGEVRISLIGSTSQPDGIQQLLSKEGHTKRPTDLSRAFESMTSFGLNPNVWFSPVTLDMASVLDYLHEVGFRHISLEIPALFAPNGLLEDLGNISLVLKAFDALGAEYLRLVEAHGPFRLNPFAEYFRRICYGEACAQFCPAAIREMATSSDGEIFACWKMCERGELPMGNIQRGGYDHSLEERFAALQVAERESCGFCWARHFCGGGCPVASRLGASRRDKPLEAYCRLIRHLIELSVAMYNSAQEHGLALERLWAPPSATKDPLSIAWPQLDIRLRPINPSDIGQILEWQEDSPHTGYFALDGVGLRSRFEMEKEMESPRDGQELMLLTDEGKRLGLVKIKPNKQWRHAEFALYVPEPQQLRSPEFAKFCRAALRQLFRDQNLNRIFTLVPEEECDLAQFFRAIGFNKEGVFQEFMYADAVYHDVAVWGLLYEDV